MSKVVLSTLAVAVVALVPVRPLAPVGPTAALHAQTVRRDATLAKVAAERRKKIDDVLTKEAREKLTAAMHDVLHQMADATEPVDPDPGARAGVKDRFASLTEPQNNLLTFYVLADLARITTDEDTLNKQATQTTRAGMHDLHKDQIARLLGLMDEGSPFAVALRRSLDRIQATPDVLVKGVM